MLEEASATVVKIPPPPLKFAMFAAFFSILAALSAVRADIPANCARTAFVQAGDTCNSISAAQGVSTFQLAFVNPTSIDANCDTLIAGEALCLGVTGQDCTDVHVVESGDFCALIASNAGIELNTLLANNPNVNSNCTNLGVGEVLCTASNVIRYIIEGKD